MATFVQEKEWDIGKFKTLKIVKLEAKNNPLASILVRVKNEAIALPIFLRSLTSQTIFADLEIVFLDSGSTDSTLDLLSNFPCSVYTIDSSEFRFGDTCNLMCSLAKSDIFLFMSGHVAFNDPGMIDSAIKTVLKFRLDAAYFRQIPNKSIGSSSYERAYLKRRFPLSEVKTVSIYESSFSNAASIILRAEWENLKFPDVLASEDCLWVKSKDPSKFRLGYIGNLDVEHSHNESPCQVFHRVRINAVAQHGKTNYRRALLAFFGVFISTYLESRSLYEAYAYARAHALGYIMKARFK